MTRATRKMRQLPFAICIPARARSVREREGAGPSDLLRVGVPLRRPRRHDALPMPTKRAVLDLLKRDELIEALAFYEIDGVDRRAREPMVDALAASRKVSLAEVVTGFSRDRLKELCRALVLDDSGREKQVLVDRLVGTTDARASDRPSTPARTKRAPVVEVVIAPGEKLTLDKSRLIDALDARPDRSHW